MLAYTSFSPSSLRFLLEKELGFFRYEGLSPEFVLVRGGGVALKGLMAGNFDYIIPTAPVTDAIIRGRQPFRIVLTTGTIHFWLVARPEISSPANLKGKIIGTSTLGSTSDLAVKEILKQHGLDPIRSVTFIATGASRERFAALSSGAIDATVLSPPFNFKALEMGYRKIAIASDYVRWPQIGLGTTEKKVVRESQEVTKMVRASMRVLGFVLTQREYLISKAMQIFNLNREEAGRTYEFLKEEAVPMGYLTEEAERSIISIIKQAANIGEEIPPQRVFDNRFVKQVEQELKGWKPQVPR